MPDQNLPIDPDQNPVQGNTPNDPTAPRPVLTTEEVPATTTPPPQDPTQPAAGANTSTPPPPTIPEETDVPPPPGPGPTDAVIPSTPTEPKPADTSPSFDLPPITGSPPRKKFGGKRVSSTILGLLLLVGGVGVGVTLVRKQQDIREKAAPPTNEEDC